MPHLVSNVASNGVEFVVCFRVFNVDFESVFNLFQWCGAIDSVAPVGERKDIAFFFLDIKLVLDFSHNLLQHIFDGDESCNATKLIDHDSQVVSISTKVSEQVVKPFCLRDKYSLSKQCADVEFWGSLKLKQVFSH